MADILMPAPAPASGAAPAWITASVALLLGLAAAWWWYRNRPLKRLRRELAQGHLAPRAAAHRLARLTDADSGMRTELDRLRFQRQPPPTDAVAALIRCFDRGH